MTFKSLLASVQERELHVLDPHIQFVVPQPASAQAAPSALALASHGHMNYLIHLFNLWYLNLPLRSRHFGTCTSLCTGT